MANGDKREVQLETYQAANDRAELSKAIIQALVSGVSTREVHFQLDVGRRI